MMVVTNLAGGRGLAPSVRAGRSKIAVMCGETRSGLARDEFESFGGGRSMGR